MFKIFSRSKLERQAILSSKFFIKKYKKYNGKTPLIAESIFRDYSYIKNNSPLENQRSKAEQSLTHMQVDGIKSNIEFVAQHGYIVSPHREISIFAHWNTQEDMEDVIYRELAKNSILTGNFEKPFRFSGKSAMDNSKAVHKELARQLGEISYQYGDYLFQYMYTTTEHVDADGNIGTVVNFQVDHSSESSYLSIESPGLEYAITMHYENIKWPAETSKFDTNILYMNSGNGVKIIQSENMYSEDNISKLCKDPSVAGALGFGNSPQSKWREIAIKNPKMMAAFVAVPDDLSLDPDFVEHCYKIIVGLQTQEQKAISERLGNDEFQHFLIRLSDQSKSIVYKYFDNQDKEEVQRVVSNIHSWYQSNKSTDGV